MKGIENQPRAEIFRSLKNVFKIVICIRFYNSFQRRRSSADQVRMQYRFLQVIEMLALGVTIWNGMKIKEYLTKLGQHSEILKLKIQKNEILMWNLHQSWRRLYQKFDLCFKFDTDSHFFSDNSKHCTELYFKLHCIVLLPACLWFLWHTVETPTNHKSQVTSHFIPSIISIVL